MIVEFHFTFANRTAKAIAEQHCKN